MEIPQDIAREICIEIRNDNRGKWFSLRKWQCWGCIKFSKGNNDRMCLKAKPGFSGCNLINTRYSKQPHD